MPLGAVLQAAKTGESPIYKKNPLKGFPDICGIFQNGRMFAFEVKAKKGVVSTEQHYWHRLLKGMNCICHVVYSLDDVIDIVNSYFDGSYELKVKDQYE